MATPFKKNLRLLAIFLLLYTSVNCQKNFKDGYVVLKNGDTLRGQINYQNWEINPLKIQFQNGSSITTYKPEDLSYFEIAGGDRYISKIITKDMKPTDVLALSIKQDNEDTLVTDTAFLRVLTDGKNIKLYEVIDHKSHYYIQHGNDGKIEELQYKKYLVNESAMAHEATNIDERTIYKNQLAVYVSGAISPEEALKNIERSKYNEKDLVLIVRLLNGEDLQSVKNSELKKKNPMQVMVGGGLVDYSFKFTGQVEKWNSFNFSNGIGPVADIAIDIFSKRNLQSLAIRFELSYSHLIHNGEYEANDLLSHPTQYNYKLIQNNIIPAISILYHFVNLEHFRMYGGLGFGFVFSSYPVNEYRSKVIATGVEEVKEDDIKPDKLWISPNITLGARIWEKVNVSVSGKVGGGFINYGATRATFFPLTLTVSYIILSKK